MKTSMFGYYLELALYSLRRSKALTLLMIVAIALGIGACMTTLTVLHVLSGDPLPERSGRLFMPQVDPRTASGFSSTSEPEEQVTWIDGMNLLHAGRATRQVLMTGGVTPVQPENPGQDPFRSPVRMTTADFFPMFDVPFAFGHAWNAGDDESRSRIAVISSGLNDRLFKGQDSTGRTVRVNGADMRIVGVLKPWRPHPHFYDINMGDFAEDEDVFVPLTTGRDLQIERMGSVDCWGSGTSSEDALEKADCAWLQYWVQLDSPAAVAAYKQFLVDYSSEQKVAGRFERPPNVRLRSLMEWLDFQRVVPDDVRLQSWLALGFLLVCLVNTVGLMLAKFLRRSGDVGVRRALGASRGDVFAQLLTESGMIGLAGGIGGLLLTMVGLWLVRQQPDPYARFATLDMSMLALTFLLAIGATLVAGLLPAWRACQVAPALQLKTQ